MKNPELILFLFLLAHDMAFKNVVSQALLEISQNILIWWKEFCFLDLVEYLKISDDIQIYL